MHKQRYKHEPGDATVPMFLKRLTFLCFLCLLCLATHLRAQDWDGPYVGGFVGFSDGPYRIEEQLAGFYIDGPGVGGVALGLRGGVNQTFGDLLLGVDISIGTGPAGHLPQGTNYNTGISCSSGDCYVSFRAIRTARLRAGWISASQDTLYYASFGVAAAQAEGGIINSRQQGTSRAQGHVLGVGIEHQMPNGRSIYGDLSHYDLGVLRFGTGFTPSDPITAQGSFTSFTLGINQQF